MPKLLLTIFLTCCLSVAWTQSYLPNYQPFSYYCRPDTVYYYNADQSLSTSTLYFYNSHGDLDSSEIYLHNVLIAKDVYFRNADFRLDSSYSYSVYQGNFMVSRIKTYKYDVLNRMTEYALFAIDAGTTNIELKLQEKDVITYNQDGHLSESNRALYSKDTIYSSYAKLFEYDNIGRLSLFDYASFSHGLASFRWKMNYFYVGNSDRVLHTMAHDFDPLTNQFIPFYRTNFTYVANADSNTTISVMELFQDQTWKFDGRDTKSENPDGVKLSSLLELYSESLSKWYHGISQYYTFDAFGRYKYADDFSCGDYRGRTVFNYRAVSGVTQGALPPPRIVVFPNPAQGVLHIAGSDATPIRLLDVVNASGKQFPVSNDAVGSLDISQFPSGAYFLRIEVGGIEVSKPFIKH
jgi:Secretion system C-terminal sorting domain